MTMSRAHGLSLEMIILNFILIVSLEITANYAARKFPFSINPGPPRLSALLNINRTKRAAAGDCLLAEGQFSFPEKRKLRFAHNQLRRNMKTPAEAMRRLDWSVHLAKRAQALADTCVYGHDELFDCGGKRMGQNLFVTWGDTVYPELNVTEVVLAWHDEIDYYDLTLNSCYAVCGHYKQVTWWSTKWFGCGIKYCPVLTHPGAVDKKKAIYVVCDYSPAGNYADGRPYTPGTTCSNCPNDTKCNNGLCIPLTTWPGRNLRN